MAVSSRPDPTSPSSIADAAFSTVRRGCDPAEVREFLRAVGAEVSRLHDRQRELEYELRAAQDAAAVPPPELDDDVVASLVGEETLRVLQTARESAAQIKAKADEHAARLVRDAEADAVRLRAEAEAEAARIRSDASNDAEAELALAKQQGRDMVNEAKAYRERVLSELARRREAARDQIGQLVRNRDRLLEVFERAQLVAGEIVAEIGPLEEPDEIELPPVNEPEPVTRLDALVEAPSADANDDNDDNDDNVVALFPAGEATGAPSAEPAATPADVPSDASAEPRSSSEATRAAERPDVDGLFARLRAETSTGGDADADTAESVSDAGPHAATDDAATDHAGPDDAGPDDASPDADELADSIFHRRDEALVPLIVAAARKLKRVLADEQNDVLDTLRRAEPVTELAQLLPSVGEQLDRYAAAVDGELQAAFAAGTASIDQPVAGGAATGPDRARELLGTDLLGPLRDRLERAVADGTGDNDDIVRRVRAVYREWKTQHIDDQLDDVFRLAHGAGVLAAVEAGTPMCWMVDPHGPACPDAEDNALAGDVPAGEAYPTGHVLAPAHAGCRCLLARSAQ